MLESRCIIPASGYYEWETTDQGKEKYAFHLEDQPMYMAGIFRKEKDVDIPTFVVLTRTPPIPEIYIIHNRMPVIIPKDKVHAWLHDSPEMMNEAIVNLSFEAV